MKKITSIIIVCIAFLSYSSYGVTTDQAYMSACKNPQIYQADKILNGTYKDLKGVLSPNEKEVLKTEQRKWVAGLSKHIVIVNNKVQITQDLLSYIEIRNGQLVDQWNARIDSEQSSIPSPQPSRPVVTQLPLNSYQTTPAQKLAFERQFSKPSKLPTPTPIPTVEPTHYAQSKGTYESPNKFIPENTPQQQTKSEYSELGYGILIIIGLVILNWILVKLGIISSNSGGSSSGSSYTSNTVDTTKYITTVTQTGDFFTIIYTEGNSSSPQRKANNSGIMVGYTQSVVTYHHPNAPHSLSTYNINTREYRHGISC